MNKYNAHLYLPLVQALADGRVIQYNGNTGWQDMDQPSFHSAPDRYRIKPEPREWWQVRTEHGLLVGDYATQDAALRYVGPNIYTTVHVREILP